MKYSELCKKLKSCKHCTYIDHGKSHDLWKNNLTGQIFTVPRHKSKEIPIGTAHSILKNAGINI